MLVFAQDPCETLKLMDLMQRLGVAYHFETEFDEALKKNVLRKTVTEDVYTISLLFRILRERAFPISAGNNNRMPLKTKCLIIIIF